MGPEGQHRGEYRAWAPAAFSISQALSDTHCGTKANYYHCCLHALTFPMRKSRPGRVSTKHRGSKIISRQILMRGLSQRCLWSDRSPECHDGERIHPALWNSKHQHAEKECSLLSMGVESACNSPGSCSRRGAAACPSLSPQRVPRAKPPASTETLSCYLLP